MHSHSTDQPVPKIVTKWRIWSVFHQLNLLNNPLKKIRFSVTSSVQNKKKPICAKCMRIFCRIKTFRSAVENDAVERWYKRSSSDIYNIATNYVTPVGVLYDLQVTYESSYCSNCSRITFPHFTLHTSKKKEQLRWDTKKIKSSFTLLC